MSKWIPYPTYFDKDKLPSVKRYLDYLIKYGIKDDKENREAFLPAIDIALIKVYPPFPRDLTDGRHYLLNPVCLPVHKSYTYKGAATFYGFGNIEHWSQIFPVSHEYLLKGEVNLTRCHLSLYCMRWAEGQTGGKPCGVSHLHIDFRVQMFTFGLHFRAIPEDLSFNTETIREECLLES